MTGRKRRYAAMTMVRDEDFFLRIWFNYYAGQFGAENLFIIDHNSQETPPRKVVGDGPTVLRLPMTNPIIDPTGENRSFDTARFRFVSDQITALLQYYDAVIFNDADEIFVTNTDASLKDYLDSLSDIGLRAGMGTEVFHDPIREPKFDPGKGIFQQRRYFRYRFLFCKPWVVGEPGRKIGGHGARDGFHLDPNLVLIHMHHMDLDQLMRRRRQRLQAFAEGRGGLRSRWKDHLPKARMQIQRFANIEPQPDDMPHTDLLEELFPRYREQIFDGKNYTRVEGNQKRLVQVERFVTEAHKEMLFTNRFQYPDRYVSKA
ncbi:MAG: glycosyltransferase family 2 protein [Pseudomonadota bacterium]